MVGKHQKEVGGDEGVKDKEEPNKRRMDCV